MSNELIGSAIGHYKLIGPLGQGRLGTVYRAEDTTSRQAAAVKVFPLGLLEDAGRRSLFYAEARRLAGLAHPSILPLTEFGDAEARPYLVTPLMAGGSLADRLVEGPLDLREAVRIFTPIAEALDYAHAQGILHRALKPGNILFDERDRPLLADFALETITGAAQVPPTPEYLSPEQVRRQPLDGRTDVYALGAVAYHALTGQPPFSGSNDAAILFRHATEPPRSPRELRPKLPADAEAALLKALAKNPNERYGSASEFVPALAVAERSPQLGPAAAPASRPLAAPPATRGSRQGRRTVPGVIVVAAVSVVCLFSLGAASMLLSLGRITGSARRAQETQAVSSDATFEALLGATQTAVAEDREATAEARPTESLALLEEFTSNQNDWDTGESSDEYATITQSIAEGKYRWEVRAKQPMSWTASPSMRQITDFTLTADLRQVDGPRDADYGVVFRAENDNNFYYYGISEESSSYAFYVLHRNTWKAIIPWHKTAAIRAREVNRLTVQATGSHFSFFINDQPAGEAEDTEFRIGKVGVGIGLNNAGDQATFEFYRLEAQPSNPLPGASPTAGAARGPTPPQVAGSSVLTGHTDKVRHAAWSPDGSRLVTASLDGTARVWYASNGGKLALLEGHTGPLNGAAWSPDGKRIVTASDDGTARVWDAASGAELIQLTGHTGTVYGAAWSPDGARIVTAGQDGTARIWDADSGAELARLEVGAGPVFEAVWSPDGRQIVATAGFTAQVWEAASGARLALLEGHKQPVSFAAWSPDGTRIVTSGSDAVRVWNAASGVQIAVLGGKTTFARPAAWSPDGTRILTLQDNTAHVWDAASGHELAMLAGHTRPVWQAAWSPDGSGIVTASLDGTARVWNLSDTASPVVLTGHTDAVGDVAWSPDGTQVVTASWDHTARVWEVGP